MNDCDNSNGSAELGSGAQLEASAVPVGPRWNLARRFGARNGDRNRETDK
jgi:hypothetical protein